MPPAVDGPWGLAVAVLVGAEWGSFLNQVADRTPRRASGPPAAAGILGRRLSLLHPARSVCFGCGRPIPWTDNLPVLSYLLLRGRCRRCGQPIGRRTLLLEAATPLAFAVLWWAPGRPAGLAGLLLGWGVAGWALLAAVLLVERRRITPAFRATGAALAAAAAALLLWGS